MVVGEVYGLTRDWEFGGMGMEGKEKRNRKFNSRAIIQRESSETHRGGWLVCVLLALSEGCGLLLWY